MERANGTRGRILIVEDDAVICRLCQVVLTGDGFEVDIASNGKIAQEKLAKCDYALLIIDLRMPMNGQGFYQFLAVKFPMLSSKVIFTTGDTLSQETRHFLESSKKPLLSKPFGPQDLKAIVSKTLIGLGK